MASDCGLIAAGLFDAAVDGHSHNKEGHSENCYRDQRKHGIPLKFIVGFLVIFK